MTVKARTEKLKQDIEKLIADFRNETHLMPEIIVIEKKTRPCESVIHVSVSVEEELLPLEIA